MPCSYLYLTGTLDADATIGAGGAITIEASDNNGNSWKPAGALTAGASKVDLTPIVYDRYDYRLKFTLKGAGTSIKALKLTHDTQHSQRALPALGAGENSLSFSSGPQEGTITVEARHQPGAFPSLADFKAKVENCDEGTLKQWGTLAPVGAQEASLTIPVETPGDIARVRVGCDYRARDAAEGWDIAASFDEGKTWQAAGRAAGPTAQDCASVSVDAPAGARRALVRITGKSKGGLVLFRERIDADYKEPAGAFAPVKVTYEWEENGQAKSDVHIATSEKDAYKINCAVKPVMKAITLELAE
jgi:hypothetical protein